MSYLEKIRASGRDANPFFRLMGIDIVSVGDGKAVLRMIVRGDMLNGEQYLQGGIFTALADEAMALAIYSVLGEDQSIATISESTSYLSGAGPGDILIADGSIVKKGRRVVFAEGLVRTEGKKDIASRTSAAFALVKT